MPLHFSAICNPVILLKTVYVVDAGMDNIYRWNLFDGNSLPAFGGHGDRPGHYNVPVYISTTPSGELLVVDQGNDRIQRVGGTGRCYQVIGDATTLLRPRAVAMTKTHLVCM